MHFGRIEEEKAETLTRLCDEAFRKGADVAYVLRALATNGIDKDSCTQRGMTQITNALTAARNKTRIYEYKGFNPTEVLGQRMMDLAKNLEARKTAATTKTLITGQNPATSPNKKLIIP